MSTTKRSVPEIPAPAERQIIHPRSRQAAAVIMRDMLRLTSEYRQRLHILNNRLAALLDNLESPTR